MQMTAQEIVSPVVSVSRQARMKERGGRAHANLAGNELSCKSHRKNRQQKRRDFSGSRAHIPVGIYVHRAQQLIAHVPAHDFAPHRLIHPAHTGQQIHRNL